MLLSDVASFPCGDLGIRVIIVRFAGSSSALLRGAEGDPAIILNIPGPGCMSGPGDKTYRNECLK